LPLALIQEESGAPDFPFIVTIVSSSPTRLNFRTLPRWGLALGGFTFISVFFVKLIVIGVTGGSGQSSVDGPTAQPLIVSAAPSKIVRVFMVFPRSMLLVILYSGNRILLLYGPVFAQGVQNQG
jgi:hypothetical protein